MKSSRSVSLRAPLKPAISNFPELHSHSRRAHPEDDVTGGRLRYVLPLTLYLFGHINVRVRDRQLTALAAGCAAQSSWRLLTV